MSKTGSPGILTRHASSSQFANGSQSIHYLFSQTYPHCHTTHHHYHHEQHHLFFSQTILVIPQPYPSQLLLLTNPSFVEWQPKDLFYPIFGNRVEKNNRVDTCGFTERLNDKSGTRYNISTSVTTYLRTAPEGIRWNGRPRAQSILREILPVPNGPTNRPLVDTERGLGRGVDSEGVVQGTST